MIVMIVILAKPIYRVSWFVPKSLLDLRLPDKALSDPYNYCSLSGATVRSS